MPETLFLTVNLIDRFLEKKQVTRRNLQLVGVTAMLIASKYEEIWAPEVRGHTIHRACTWGVVLQRSLSFTTLETRRDRCRTPLRRPSPAPTHTKVRDFVYISDKAYTREQILECEKLVLNTLKFNLTLPTCYNFLARFLKVWRVWNTECGVWTLGLEY
jgi:hypothetical protein